MKRTGLIAGGVVLGLVLLLGVLPTIFKKKIIAGIDRELARRVNADVRFDHDRVSLSLLRRFPHLSVSLADLSVAGRAPFRGDTLVAAPEFSMTINLLSLLSGDRFVIRRITLDEPRILVKTLKTGQSNYDIFLTDSVAAATPDTGTSEFEVKIRDWELSDARVIYDDRENETYVRLDDLDHEGSGDFTETVFDLVTQSNARALTLRYGGTEYLSEKKVTADVTLNVDLNQQRYTFRDNRVRLNDLPLHFDGSLALPDTSLRMDLTFRADEANFRNLLSLVPGLYSDRFRNIQAKGTVRFEGFAKGTYDGSQTPAFRLTVGVKNGGFKYPDRPMAVEDVQVAATFENPTNQLRNTHIDIPTFRAKLGDDPVQGHLRMSRLDSGTVDARLLGRIRLDELRYLLPLDSLNLRGLFDVDLTAKGLLTKTRFPVTNGRMRLQDGYLKSATVAEPLEAVNASAQLLNTTGTRAGTRLVIPAMNARFAGEPIAMSGTISDFADYAYDLKAKGKVDLGKLTQLFPVEGTRLAGLLDADVQARGRYADLEAERYERVAASGTASLQKFSYAGEAVPKPIQLSAATMQFTPTQLRIPSARGRLGNSDFTASGTLSNYLAYALTDDAPLRGALTVRSERFDVNEWLSDSGDTTTASSATSVVELPRNMNLTIDAAVGRAAYERMPLSDLRGTLALNGGVLRMNQLAFNALGGRFVTSGSYDPRDLQNPRFDFALNIDEAAIPEAWRHLTFVKALMPLTQYLVGDFSSNFKIDGLLGPDMMPRLNTLTGSGLIRIIEATLGNAPIVEKLAERIKLARLKNSKFSNVLMQAEIDDGKVAFRPFDVQFAPNHKLTVSGANGIDGSLDYRLAFDIPSGGVGAAFGQVFRNWTGGNLPGTDRVQFDLNLKGQYRNPQIAFLGSSTADDVKRGLLDQARDRLGQVVRGRRDTSVTRPNQPARDFLNQQKEKLLDRVLPGRRRDTTRQGPPISRNR
jgi:uncharacterized protein involved in outer membrane biogenesis